MFIRDRKYAAEKTLLSISKNLKIKFVAYRISLSKPFVNSFFEKNFSDLKLLSVKQVCKALSAYQKSPQRVDKSVFCEYNKGVALPIDGYALKKID